MKGFNKFRISFYFTATIAYLRTVILAGLWIQLRLLIHVACPRHR